MSVVACAKIAAWVFYFMRRHKQKKARILRENIQNDSTAEKLAHMGLPEELPASDDLRAELNGSDPRAELNGSDPRAELSGAVPRAELYGSPVAAIELSAEERRKELSAHTSGRYS